MTAEVVTVPMAVHGKMMPVPVMMPGMVAVVMAIMVRAVVIEMRKAMPKKKPCPENPCPKKPWPCPWPPLPWATASLCAKATNRKNVETVASVLIEAIGLDPRH